METAIKRRRTAVRANRRLWKILKNTVGKGVLNAFDVRSNNQELLGKVEPPYFIFANHVTNWDPVFIGALSEEPISYVTSDNLFRGRFMDGLLNLLGAIPKTKFRSDMDTVKRIFQIRSQKGVIGIFPEGRRTWNGATMSILFATAKLVKTVKIPVVVSLIKGGYLWAPRWGRKRRRGPVTIDFSLGLTRDEIKALSVEEIQDRLEALLHHDDYQFQEAAGNRYKSRRPAEYLELVLSLCPGCGEVGSLRSKGRRLVCGHCGFEVEMDEEGTFHLPGTEEVPPFKNVGSWDRWQTGELSRKYRALSEKPGGVLFEDRHVHLLQGAERGFKKHRFGTARIETGRIRLLCRNGEILDFPFADMEGVNVQMGEQFEFFMGEKLYRFGFSSPRVSSYKWLTVIRIAKGEID